MKVQNIQKCSRKINASSNLNEVIRAVLNSLLIFLQKDFTRTKSTKAQRRNQAKVQKHK